MSLLEVIEPLDAVFGWDGARLRHAEDLGPDRVEARALRSLRGAAACVQPGDGGRWRVLRDPLGINKLFWCRDDDGRPVLAARPRRLVDRGHPFARIRAVPRGCVADLGPARPEPEAASILPTEWAAAQGDPGLGVEEAGRRIRRSLDAYLGALAAADPSAPAFVCLSGGLDSSGIAALALRHFPALVAVSFDLRRRGGAGASEDRLVARRLARELGMPLLEATVGEEELLEPLDTVLVEAVDWRDFNVHAGLVNAALAACIAAAEPAARRGPALVITGDLHNELLVDYHPERYRGRTHYDLPRLAPHVLRASLVAGLDTSHREVGVFAAWGLSVVQPYAVAVDAYLALPRGFLELEDRKERLCRAVFGDLIPAYVYSRPKVRAQLGSADGGGGVLGACVDRGIDGLWLQRRFAELHGVDDLALLARFIRAGRYVTAVPSPSGGP
jgi:asparagine synthetase B (glutamine-hydrolysing)